MMFYFPVGTIRMLWHRFYRVSPSNVLFTVAKSPKFATHTVIWKGTTTVLPFPPSGKPTFIFLVGGCSIQTFSTSDLREGEFCPTSRTAAFIFATTKNIRRTRTTTLLLAV